MLHPVPRIVFYSSKSENTVRFVNKVNLPSVRLPVSTQGPFPVLTEDYIIVVPTFGAGKTMGAIPMAVRKFLNDDEHSRKHCVGVMGSGNTSFGSYATSVDLLSKKLEVPALYKFEVLGMPEDVIKVRSIIFELFPDQLAYAEAEPRSFAHPSAFR